MHPPAFDYSAPGSVEEAVALLAELGDDGRVLAGGQSLIPMMKLRQAAPGHLVDINRIPDLAYVRGSDGHLVIGALARHSDVVDSDLVRSTSTAMAAAAPWVADPLVRNRGTLVGSVAHCDPKGDWNSVMLALDAEVVALSSAGERVIAISDFVVDYFTNGLQPGEMVTEVRVPKDPPRSGGTYMKLERKIGDYATVGVAAFLALDQEGRVERAGLALTSVGPRNLKVTEAEEMMRGQEPSTELFGEAAEMAARVCSPDSDVRGPAEYKRDMVRVYGRRSLARALSRARGEA
jgi:carbon-monoxide dehydrogenase medium subunit